MCPNPNFNSSNCQPDTGHWRRQVMITKFTAGLHKADSQFASINPYCRRWRWRGLRQVCRGSWSTEIQSARPIPDRRVGRQPSAMLLHFQPVRHSDLTNSRPWAELLSCSNWGTDVLRCVHTMCVFKDESYESTGQRKVLTVLCHGLVGLGIDDKLKRAGRGHCP